MLLYLMYLGKTLDEGIIRVKQMTGVLSVKLKAAHVIFCTDLKMKKKNTVKL